MVLKSSILWCINNSTNYGIDYCVIKWNYDYIIKKESIIKDKSEIVYSFKNNKFYIKNTFEYNSFFLCIKDTKSYKKGLIVKPIYSGKYNFEYKINNLIFSFNNMLKNDNFKIIDKPKVKSIIVE